MPLKLISGLSYSSDGTISGRAKCGVNQSPAPWRVESVQAPDGVALDESRWTFSETTQTGAANYATIVLASGSGEQETLLRDGQELMLVVSFAESQPASFNVRMQ